MSAAWISAGLASGLAAGAGVATVMPWVALAVSATALLAVVMVRRKQTEGLKMAMRGTWSETGNLVHECQGMLDRSAKLQTTFTEMLEKLRQLESKRTSPVGDLEEEEDFPVNQRFTQFIALQMAWEKRTGEKLRGAAIKDGEKIEELTEPDRRPLTTEEADMAFTVAARGVMDYVVQASGAGSAAADDEQVGTLLNQMAELAKMQLIDPARGESMDRSLHESAGHVSAGSNLRGTIAKVEVRGLRLANGSVTRRAKVLLYD